MDIDFAFTLKRTALLLGLIIIYAALGGFSIPEIPADSLVNPHLLKRAWYRCALVYLAGAVAVSVVDHFVGTMDRTNIRSVYVVGGSLAMLAAVLWMRSLNDATIGA